MAWIYRTDWIWPAATWFTLVTGCGLLPFAVDGATSSKLRWINLTTGMYQQLSEATTLSSQQSQQRMSCLLGLVIRSRWAHLLTVMVILRCIHRQAVTMRVVSIHTARSMNLMAAPTLQKRRAHRVRIRQVVFRQGLMVLGRAAVGHPGGPNRSPPRNTPPR